MAAMPTSIGRKVAVACWIVAVTGAQALAPAPQCNHSMKRAPCGGTDLTQQACEQRSCCFYDDGTQAHCFAPNDSPELRAIQSTLAVNRAGQSSRGGEASIEAINMTCVSAVATTPQPRDDDYGIGWMPWHEVLVGEVAATDAGQGYPLIFYGDSITEDFRGTWEGKPWYFTNGTVNPESQGMHDVFTRHFNDSATQRANVLAIAGDQTGHLLWRLLHGELPRVHQPSVVVLLIGTNDLGAVQRVCGLDAAALMLTAQGTITRVEAIVFALRAAMPGAQIILQGLLPRGGDGPDWLAWPNGYSKAIETINAGYQAIAAMDPQIHYTYCGDIFLTANGSQVIQALMPDALHPHVLGMDLLADCLSIAIDKLMY